MRSCHRSHGCTFDASKGSDKIGLLPALVRAVGARHVWEVLLREHRNGVLLRSARVHLLPCGGAARRAGTLFDSITQGRVGSR
jgi:hypothetical protein